MRPVTHNVARDLLFRNPRFPKDTPPRVLEIPRRVSAHAKRFAGSTETTARYTFAGNEGLRREIRVTVVSSMSRGNSNPFVRAREKPVNDRRIRIRRYSGVLTGNSRDPLRVMRNT